MTSIPEFDDLIALGSLSIQSNSTLSSFSGFSNITAIDERMRIGSNYNLVNIPSFSKLTSIGIGITLDFNNNLPSLDGFNKLTSSGYLEITGNAKLTSIIGFSLLTNNGVPNGIAISDNIQLDCTLPVPNFVPVSISTNNLVNCFVQ